MLLALLLAFALITITTGTALSAREGPGGRHMGDVVWNGHVDINDILAIRGHIFDTAELKGDDLIAADLDLNGLINIMDILYCRDIIFGIKEAPDWPDATTSPTPSPGISAPIFTPSIPNTTPTTQAVTVTISYPKNATEQQFSILAKDGP